jgi:plastocyanin
MKPRERCVLVPILLALVLAASACGNGADDAAGDGPAPQTEPTAATGPTAHTVTPEELASADLVLITGETTENLELGGFAFEGEEISSPGPTIRLASGDEVALVLQNVHGYVDDESIPHNFTVVGEMDESAEPLWGAQTETLVPDEADLITFTPDAPGSYFYICSLSGHMSAHGMWGRLVVE